MHLIRCDECGEEVTKKAKFYEISLEGMTQVRSLSENEIYHVCSWSCLMKLGERQKK